MTDEEIIKIMEKTNNLWNDRKRLEQLEKENAELKAKSNGALDICNIPEFRINDLEKENEQLKCDLYNTEANLQGMTINCEKLENKNTELKEQIEKMKCCGNCSEPCWNPPVVRKSECLSNNYSLWEMLK